jgi:hypothetical protein
MFSRCRSVQVVAYLRDYLVAAKSATPNNLSCKRNGVAHIVWHNVAHPNTP